VGEHRKPRPLIDEEFFFEKATGKQWVVVLKQVKPVIGAWRAMFSSPNFLANLEKTLQPPGSVSGRSAAPGSNEAIRKMLAQMQAGRAKLLRHRRRAARSFRLKTLYYFGENAREMRESEGARGRCVGLPYSRLAISCLVQCGARCIFLRFHSR